MNFCSYRLRSRKRPGGSGQWEACSGQWEVGSVQPAEGRGQGRWDGMEAETTGPRGSGLGWPATRGAAHPGG